MNYYLPILIVVSSNVFYHICAKSVPEAINPLASLIVTYVVGAVVALGLYYITSPVKNLTAEFGSLNWTSFVLALAIVGLEYGNIFMYKVGWNISIGSLVSNISLAIILIIIGALFYKETITMHQVAGIGLCIGGLILINK